jgi:hypothetical protein
MATYHVGVTRTLCGFVSVEAGDAEDALEAAEALVVGRSSVELARLFTVMDEEWVPDENDIFREPKAVE